jgi:acyl-CoA synthetase (AMP-forming)/AMP-acid ligase II
VGELLGKIDESDHMRKFFGYLDKRATNKKVPPHPVLRICQLLFEFTYVCGQILTNVFEKGDRWFRTGDLLRMDKGGCY